MWGGVACRLLVPIVLAFALPALLSRPARACTPGCLGMLQMPRGPNLSADHVYLRVVRAGTGLPELLRADGTVVPAGLRVVGPDQVFGPTGPVFPGEKLRFTYPGCAGGAHSQEITVVPAVPFPTSLGTLRVERTYTRSSGADVLAGATVALDPAVVAAATWAITELTLEIDGFVVEDDRPGTSVGRVGAPTFNVETVCNANLARDPRMLDECGRSAKNWLTRGRHTVTVRAHVAGAPSDPPPASVEVDLVCPGDGAAAPHGHGCALAPAGVAAVPSAVPGALALLTLLSIARRRARPARGNRRRP